MHVTQLPQVNLLFLYGRLLRKCSMNSETRFSLSWWTQGCRVDRRDRYMIDDPLSRDLHLDRGLRS
jgi:hypothetical protein